MARYSPPLHVSEEALRELEEYSQNNPDKTKRKRAAMVLAVAKGATVMKASEALSIRPSSILQWKKRYEEAGLEGFENLPRGGNAYGPDFDDRLRTTVMGPAPNGAAYWTVSLLSKELGASKDVISRHLKKENINLAAMKFAAVTEETAPGGNEPRNTAGASAIEGKDTQETPSEDDSHYDSVRITIERLDSSGSASSKSSITVDSILADIDHFDVCTVQGFKRDLNMAEQGTITGFFKLMKDFLEGEIAKSSKKKLNQNPDLPSRVHVVMAEFMKFMILAVGNMTTELNPNEIILSEAQEMLTCLELTEGGQSYRDSAASINRFQHRCGENKVKPTTLHTFAEKTGLEICKAWKTQTEGILEYYGFDPKTGLRRHDGVLETMICLPKEVPHLDPKSVAEAIAKFNEGKEGYAKIKHLDMVAKMESYPDTTVYILIDDIGVKRQLEIRAVHGHTPKKSAKNVENTVIYIQCGGKVRRIVSTDREEAMKMALAVALKNGLANGAPLVFFTDGANIIKDSIEKYFGFYKYYINLDWYHVENHVYDLASMAFNGTKESKRIINWEIKRRLWPGNYEDTVEYIKSLNPKRVRNQAKFQELLNYLERKKPYLYCYAMRKEEGYLNASSPVEKSNDLLVAQRQKHNGMSWSVHGSGALASISALRLNSELRSWVKERRTDLTDLRVYKPNIEAEFDAEYAKWEARLAS